MHILELRNTQWKECISLEELAEYKIMRARNQGSNRPEIFKNFFSC